MNSRECDGVRKYRFSKSTTRFRYLSNALSMPLHNACKYMPLLSGSSAGSNELSVAPPPNDDDVPLCFNMNLRISLCWFAILIISSSIFASPGCIKFDATSESCREILQYKFISQVFTLDRLKNPTVNSAIDSTSVSGLSEANKISWIILAAGGLLRVNSSNCEPL